VESHVNAVLLLAHGAPGDLDEVEPFLRRIRHGRPTPPAVLAEVKRRYGLIGGSPLRAITEAQARGLAQRLPGTQIFVGMRHSAPFIGEAVAAARAAGATRLFAIPLAPQASALTAGAYRRDLEEALGEPAEMAPSYCDHPLLAQAFAERIREAMAGLPAGARPTLLFTVHSLPARVVAAGDPYPEEFRRTVAAVMARLGTFPHRLAYQSQGMTDEAWLGPTVPEALQAMRAEGHTDVLLTCVGFVAENVEILYDVDIDFRAHAETLGMRLWRPRCLDDSPSFLALLETLARAGVGGA
jgi:ferrochelatase